MFQVITIRNSEKLWVIASWMHVSCNVSASSATGFDFSNLRPLRMHQTHHRLGRPVWSHFQEESAVNELSSRMNAITINVSGFLPTRYSLISYFTCRRFLVERSNLRTWRLSTNRRNNCLASKGLSKFLVAL